MDDLTRDQIDRRWQLYITRDLEWWAWRDPLLHHLLRAWVRDEGLSLRWVTERYLERWPALAELLAKMGADVETWHKMWPTWKESGGSHEQTDQGVAERARSVLSNALAIASIITEMFGQWLQLQPLPPIVVTKEQAAAMGIDLRLRAG